LIFIFLLENFIISLGTTPDKHATNLFTKVRGVLVQDGTVIGPSTCEQYEYSVFPVIRFRIELPKRLILTAPLNSGNLNVVTPDIVVLVVDT